MVQLITSGMIPSGSQLMENWNASLRSGGLTWINMLKDRALTMPADGGIFAEAYTSAGGRQGSVVTAESSAVFNTNKYALGKFTHSGPFVVIEATSVSAFSNFQINNCNIEQIALNRWVLFCTTGTDEVKRAQIYKTLFYGGTPRATSTYITGLIKLYTSVSRDAGKIAHYASLQTGTYQGATQYLGEFDNTTTNTDCSVWSYNQSTNSSYRGQFRYPTGTVISLSSNNVIDHTGTDRTADEKNNPANVEMSRIVVNTNNSTYVNIYMFLLCEGTITWTPPSLGTYSNTNFNVTHSVPPLEHVESISSLFGDTITHTIPAGTFPEDMSSSFVTFDSADFEDGASVEYKLTNATEDTGWLVPNKVETFTELTAKPDELIVKLIPKTTSPTAGFPSVRGVFLQGGKAL